MAAGEEPVPRVEDDPSTASDALSLHTIAEADAYASQEQEDADFALALALEEQEIENARTQGIAQGQQPDQIDAPSQIPIEAGDETPPPPYRDDPDALEVDGNLPPYRDDPDAVPVEGGADEADEAAAEPAKRQRAIMRIFRKLFKTWLCCLMISTIVTVVIIVVVLVFALVYGKPVATGEAAKEAAWKASGSSDYDLRLSKLYPALEKGTNDTCRNAWERAYGRTLRCHRMILSPAWDNGDADEVKAAEADPFFYSEAVCTTKCRTEIASLVRLAESCTQRTDRFDFATYGNNGRAYFEKSKLDEGPIHVAKNLGERYLRFCNKEYNFQPTKWGTCAADLWMNWGIVDGKNEAHLRGLDQFLEQTSVKKLIPGDVQKIPALSEFGTNKTLTIRVMPREVGPGPDETDCSTCTLDWLIRKMRSFEFGQILDPATGEALGLSEFRDKLRNATRRCSRGAGASLRSVDEKWKTLGWWCGDKPCKLDKPDFSNETMAVLHGLSKMDAELRGVRERLEKMDPPAKILRAADALLEGVRGMPCYMGITDPVAMREVAPFESTVARLCSDTCRNSLDRLLQQHGSLFAEAARNREFGHFFEWPAFAAKQVDEICLSTSPGSTLTSSENLCAPGYAALGYPQWIFARPYYDPPIRAQILSVFSSKIDELADRLSKRRRTCFRGDMECERTRSKMIAESACNTCAGKIFIGAEGKWKETTDAFLNDKDINGTEYVAAAKKGWRTCARMYDKELPEFVWKRMWKERGLDVYD